MKTIVGYVDAWSVAPGDTLEVKVSTYGKERYTADLVRVVCGDDDPDRGIYREEEVAAPFAGAYPGRTQIMTAGSYVVVPDPAPLWRLADFTVQAWIFPTTPAAGEQGLIAHWCPVSQSGFALILDGNGTLSLRTGDGSGVVRVASTGVALAARRWHLVSAAFAAETGHVRLRQTTPGTVVEAGHAARTTGSGVFAPAADGDVPLLMAAVPSEDGGTRRHFNGKIDRPRLTGRALPDDEVAALAWDAAPHEREAALVAAWDFSRDIGRARVADVGFNALHGQTVNLPSRGVKGFNWTGREQSWRHAPEEYGAIHFHEIGRASSRERL